MLVIEPRCGYGGDEELRSVRPRSSIRHGQGVWPVMSVFLTELILEGPSPNTLSACTVSQGITRLQHEFLDDPVEENVVVVPIFGVCDKVLDRLRCGVGEQLKVLWGLISAIALAPVFQSPVGDNSRYHPLSYVSSRK